MLIYQTTGIFRNNTETRSLSALTCPEGCSTYIQHQARVVGCGRWGDGWGLGVWGGVGVGGGGGPILMPRIHEPIFMEIDSGLKTMIILGFELPIRGLTIIERSWNSGNLLYLVANTYGLNFIKIGGIWIFKGGRNSLLGGFTCDLWCPFSNLAGLF